ncbi:MAG: PKD domain-containing protein [Vicingaceae bacterium]
MKVITFSLLTILKKMKVLKFLPIFSLVIFISNDVYSQCGTGTPTFTADLSGNVDSAWTSPDTLRADTCCGATAPDKCVAFNLTLDSAASGIIFDICDGAIPPGALFYQIGCGPTQQVGEVLCLSGPGPHYITFCKPGNNSNRYCITSIPKPNAGPDLAVNDGCRDTLNAIGYDDTTIVWTSVFPGARGDYDSSLTCTEDCPETVVNGGNNYPAFIDYEVCGRPVGGCLPTPTCDTVRVFFYTTLNVTITPENPTVCFGQAGTWIKANPSGGNPPYLYNWDTNETTDSIFVGVGTYIVELSDGSGCPPTYDTVVVTEFANPIRAFAGPDTSVCEQFLPINLIGAVQAASGGIWSGGSGTFNPSDTTLNTFYTPSATELMNNSVTLFLTTTGNGTCPADVDTITISLEEFNASISISNTNVSCKSGNDGTAAVTVTNGDPPFTYLWDTTLSSQTTASISNLTTGRYFLTVTDANGCFDTTSVNIVEPDTLLASIDSSSNVACNGGSNGTAAASGSGGTPPYTFEWPSSNTNANESGLSQGTYVVTITDNNGCTDTAAVTINQPTVLLASIDSSTAVSCNGGTDGNATVSANGGVPPYTYNWPSGGTNQTESSLLAGNYIVTVTDANACSDTILVVITEPSLLSSSILSFTNVSCNGGNNGSATVNVNGGTPPYAYSWPSGGTSSIEGGLVAGSYVVTITDSNGCVDSAGATISEPTVLIASISSATDVSCFGGSDGVAIASGQGGVLPYTYVWPSGSTSAIETGLSAGSYQVTVSDQNGCTSLITAIINEPDSITIRANITPVSCNGGSDGTITAIIEGGTRPFTYLWTTGSTDSSISALSASNYGLSLTDANGCVIDSSFNVIEPQPIVVTTSEDDTICIGNSAVISVLATGGNGNFSYRWDKELGLGASKTVNPITTTTYTVSITDSKACPIDPDSVTIYVEDLKSDPLLAQKEDDICLGESTTVFATHNGKFGPYTYIWNTLGSGLGPFTVSPTSNRNYIINVTDRCGITISDTVEVLVSPFPIINLPDTIDIGCTPLTVRFTDSLNQNTQNLSYQWDFGDGNTASSNPTSHTFLNSGDYQVSLSVINQAGCESISNSGGYVSVKPSPIADFDANPRETDINNPEVVFTNTSIGEDQFYWDFGLQSDIDSTNNQVKINYPDTGTYEIMLRVKNLFGCEDSITKLLRVNPVFDFDIPNAFSPDPNGSNGGIYNSNGTNNDVFFVFADYVREFHMMIFNRWGELIFESFDINIGWDGYYRNKICQQDVYVYKVNITWTDGSKTIEAGDITLFR